MTCGHCGKELVYLPAYRGIGCPSGTQGVVITDQWLAETWQNEQDEQDAT